MSDCSPKQLCFPPIAGQTAYSTPKRFRITFGDPGWEPPGYRLLDVGHSAAMDACLVSPAVPQHHDTGVMLHHAARPLGDTATVS